MTKIKNINGIRANNCNCNCENWLEHWNKHNDKPAVFCSEIKCTQMFGLEGTHVQKKSGEENWFLVPLCEKHRNENGEITINDFTHLIPVHNKETSD